MNKKLKQKYNIKTGNFSVKCPTCDNTATSKHPKTCSICGTKFEVEII